MCQIFFFPWGLREKGGMIRIRAIAAGIDRTVCRNKLIYGKRWETLFPESYRNITVDTLINVLSKKGPFSLFSEDMTILEDT